MTNRKLLNEFTKNIWRTHLTKDYYALDKEWYELIPRMKQFDTPFHLEKKYGQRQDPEQTKVILESKKLDNEFEQGHFVLSEKEQKEIVEIAEKYYEM